MMQSLGRKYVRYFNFTYGRTGTLWEGRFKSSVVDSELYLLTVIVILNFIGLVSPHMRAFLCADNYGLQLIT